MQTGFDIWHSWWMWLLTNSAYASLLIVLVLGAQWLFHKQLPARWRYGLWWLVLLRLALPILPESPLSIFNLIRFEAATRSSPVAVAAPRDIVEMPQMAYREKVALAVNPLPTESGQPVREITATAVPKTELWRIIRSRQSLPAFWLVGVILLVGRVLREQIRWARQIRTCIPVTQPSVLGLLKECQLAMGLTRPLVILETRLVSSPALHGLFRPQLLLPAGFTERFSLRDLRYVFLHELAHVKRRDIAVNWLATGLQILHWFNPLVWLAFSRMRADRELACDAMALSVTDPGENRAYGQTIIRLLEGFVRPTTMPGLIGILEANSHMKQRMVGIARFKKAAHVSVLAALIVIALGVVSLTNARSRSQPAETITANTGGGTVIGRVVDDRGEPIQYVNVIQSDGIRAFTDKDGRFSFTNAPAGARYTFKREPFYQMRDQALKSGGEEQTIVIWPQGDISCRVLDAGTGKPIPSFWLVPGVIYGERTSWQWNQRTTGTNGTCVFRRSAVRSFEHLPGKLMAGAQGYSPAASARLDPTHPEATIELRLSKGQPIQGIILQPDGQPAKWADVFLWDGEANLADIPEDHRWTTDATGKFSFEPALAQKVLVSQAKGFADLTLQELKASPRITLRRGGAVTGVARLGGKPAANQKVWLRPLSYNYQPSLPNQVAFNEVDTDANGQFTIIGVPEGDYWVGFEYRIRLESLNGVSMRSETSHAIPVFVAWDQTNHIVLGGSGRKVIGQLIAGQGALEPNWNKAFGMLSLRLPEVASLPGISINSIETFRISGSWPEASRAFWLSQAGKDRQRATRHYIPTFNTDGSFCIEDVPAGTYQLTITVPAQIERRSPKKGELHIWTPVAGTHTQEFVVPAMPSGSEEQPLNLGKHTLNTDAKGTLALPFPWWP